MFYFEKYGNDTWHENEANSLDVELHFRVQVYFHTYWKMLFQ